MDLLRVARDFATDEQCLAYLEQRRWPSGVCCIQCGGEKISRTVTTSQNKRQAPRRLYACLDKDCAFQFSATSQTLFHDSHIELPKWFMAIALLADAKKSISALQLQRHLGLGSYRSAWLLAKKIRKAMAQEGGVFGGPGKVVEADENVRRRQVR